MSKGLWGGLFWGVVLLFVINYWFVRVPLVADIVPDSWTVHSSS